MELQKELKTVKEIIENLNYDVLSKEKQKEIQRFFKDVDNFSKYFIANMPDKEQVKAIEYLYYKIGFKKLQKENPYILSNFSIFRTIGYPIYNNKISRLLKGLISDSDLPKDIQNLNKQYVNEVIDRVVSPYYLQLNSMVMHDNYFFNGYYEDIENFICERFIPQRKMIWLYNLYTNSNYVYAEKIYKIFDCSWEDEVEEELKQEVLIDQRKDSVISLTRAEEKLTSKVTETFLNISGIIEINMRKKYSNLDGLYNELTNKGTDLKNLYLIDLEGEAKNKEVLEKWLQEVF